MTDDEILLELAKIEFGLDSFLVKDASPETRQESYWNPLQSDAQAMALVKKYRMDVWYEYDRDKWAADASDTYYEANESLNRAICLAIIEAHK